MAKKKKPKPPLPKPKPEPLPLVLYVVKGGGGDPTFFGRERFTDEQFDDGERIGIYDLREVRTMAITRGLR